MRQELVIALALVELAEGGDGAQRRGKVDLPSPGKHLRGRAKASPGEVVAHGRVEVEQDLEQTCNVLRRPPMDDVEVGGRDRYTLEHGGDAADDDELDS